MSLGDQFRTALNHQADGRSAPPPDVQGLISGGRARRRRRNATRAGFGVAAVMLVLGGCTASRRSLRLTPSPGRRLPRL